jgi:hypothetical protein
MSTATFNLDEFGDEFVAPKEQPKTKLKKFIIRQERIDQHNTKRTRQEFTPSMCAKCRFDAAEKHGGWQRTPTSEKEIVLDVLNKHIELAHNTSEDLIVEEGELPTNWLGGKTIYKDL